MENRLLSDVFCLSFSFVILSGTQGGKQCFDFILVPVIGN